MADADQEFSSWMHEWADLLVRFTYGHTKDLGLAQDIAQETFLRAFQKFSRRNRPLPSPGWLYLVASRLAIDSYRKRRREVSLAEAPPLSMMKLDAAWNPRIFEGVMALSPRIGNALSSFTIETAPSNKFLTVFGFPQPP